MSAPAAAIPAPRGTRSGVLDAYRAEQRKLTAQLATRVLALVCVLAPFAFGAVLSLQSGVPGDTLLGVWVHSSGYSVAFVVLGFCGYLGFPVLAGVLAGDVFSSEDRYGTWKSVLTRSRSRGQLFAGKCLAVFVLTAALLTLLAVSSLLSGLLFTGGQSMVGLAGNTIGSGQALGLLVLSWLLSLPPLFAFASLAVLLSTASRSGIVGVLGPLLTAVVMQLLALVGGGSWMHALLITNAFAAWHGLLGDPRFYAPLWIGEGVAVAWCAACLGAAWLLLRNRDFAGRGGAISRAAGWIAPARAVLAVAVLVVLLAVAGGLGPAAITRARVQASFASVFERLTVLQQHELGRPVPAGAKLESNTACHRHAGASTGPGDDWSCTVTLLHPGGGPELLQTTTVTYDVSVKSEGCWKAQAPPSFVGSQTMVDARRRSVVNPLFAIYGCFDTTAAAAKPAVGTAPKREAKPSASQRELEKRALSEAEKQAGPTVMREVQEAERQERRRAE